MFSLLKAMPGLTGMCKQNADNARADIAPIILLQPQKKPKPP